ncbi:MAG: hypothetical protein ACR2MK_11795 [Solirubrobacteraceae bacterium]
MPSFCRHNRLLQNCPICAREQHVELRPVVSPGGQGTGQQRTGASRPNAGRGAGSPRTRAAAGRSATGVRVRQLTRGGDDGYRSSLVPGLKSSADAQRLAEELAFGAARLAVLEHHPPGLYAEVADRSGDREERTWLAFLIACLGPLDGEQPFAAISRVRTSWSSAALPDLAEAEVGPRGALWAGGGARTLEAYRSWAARSGSQASAFTGESDWTPERRFARALERLALPRFPRGARFDLLTTLGRLGLYEMRAGALALGGTDEVTLAAKRVLGIGDPLLLERRAAELASACELPLEALDVGLYNWGQGTRAMLGMDASVQADPVARETARAALGL